MSDDVREKLSSFLLRSLTVAPLVLPPIDRLSKVIDRILDRSEAGHDPVADTEKVFAQMLERISNGRWERTPLSLVTRSAGLVFKREHLDRKDLAELKHFLLAEIPNSTRSGFLNPMVRVYVESYISNAPHTKALASALSVVSHRLGKQWQDLLKRFPAFFDPIRAPEEIGARMAQMDDQWSGLRELGFRNPHAPGLLDAAHLSYLRAIAPKLNDRREVERLLEWLRPKTGQTRLSGAAEAIDAVMRPWLNHDPSDDFKKLILDGITGTYGHPMVDRKSTWNLVDPSCEELCVRWLTGADLELMFDVLTQANEGHMWATRHKFWLTLYKQKRIDQAWVAFNDAGYKIAKKRLERVNAPNMRRFSFSGDPQKSLLIMKIGSKIIVEGTWNFKVHIFDLDNRSAPKLYATKYSATEIRLLPNSESRIHDIHGHWMTWVLKRI